MDKKSAEEAAAIVQRSLDMLVRVVPTTGRTGSDLRLTCGRLSANAQALLQADAAGQPLSDCFELARQNDATQAQLAGVRGETLAETPVTLGAVLVKNAIVRLCLATEARVIADMSFTNRPDVEALQSQTSTVYAGVEETAADDMDQESFQALVALHAALNGFLTDEARPLPIMLQFRFAHVMPSVVMGQRLYADAGRADELRAENKIVHPAFMQLSGRALAG